MFGSKDTPFPRHPRIEQLMIQMALEHLTPKQQRLWELWNYDKLTQDEIAGIFNVKQHAISQQIKTIEHRVARWIKRNKGAYVLLKMEQKIMEKDNE